jgi:serine/threonine-protein kinase
MLPEQLGPYRIERTLGRGGMGTVYAAIEIDSQQPAAVKVLAAALGLEEGFRDRFAAEIESLRLLRHPNIVRLLGYGTEGLVPDGELHFYAMELVSGQSLEELLRAGRQFSWREAVDIVQQVCRALKHAHDRGVVHRDIKPANLLLAMDGVVKLSDFGIARLFGNARLTADGGLLGTAEYRSPEQADGRPATQRSDLYSLGSVLYTLVAGRAPFRAKTVPEMLQLQRFAEPDPLKRVAPSTPRELSDIVSLLLAKDPDQRIPTALVLQRRLEILQSSAARGEELSGAVPLIVPGSPHASLPVTKDDAPMNEALAEEATVLVGQKDERPPAKPELAVQRATGQKGSERSAIAMAVTAVLPISAASAASEAAGALAADRPQAGAPLGSPVVSNAMAGGAEAAGAVAGGAVAANANAASVPESRRRFIVVSDDDPLATVHDNRQAWVSPQTWGLVMALLCIGSVAWWLLQPPSADELYTRLDAAAKDDRVDRLAMHEDDIDRFLSIYAADPRGAEVYRWREQVDQFKLERRFMRQVRRGDRPQALSAMERAYFDAMSIHDVAPSACRRKLQALVDLYGPSNAEEDLTPMARVCLQIARRQIEALDAQLREHAALDAEVVRERLLQAARSARSDPEASRRIYRATIDLYGDQAWAADLVAQARRELSALGE